MFKKEWTAKEADEWTKEDIFACIFSVIAYIGLSIGFALALLKMPIGYITFVIGIIAVILMFTIIDPKLKAISEEYEKKQKEYLTDLENIVKWKE